MYTQDVCCTLVPYFKIPQQNQVEFEQICTQFVAKTKDEPGCLFYGFSFYEDLAHCREGYKDAEGLLEHLSNVSSLLEEALKLAELVRLEIHGPETELAKLREPLSHLNPQFFTLKYGFRC